MSRTNHKSRKSQISLMILLGALVLCAFVFVITMKDAFFTLGVKKVEGFEDFQTVIEGCLTSSANYGFYITGRQGGYVDLNVNYLTTPFAKIAISKSSTRNTLVELDHVDDELVNLIKELTPRCIIESLPPQHKAEFEFDEIDAKLRFSKGIHLFD